MKITVKVYKTRPHVDVWIDGERIRLEPGQVYMRAAWAKNNAHRATILVKAEAQ